MTARSRATARRVGVKREREWRGGIKGGRQQRLARGTESGDAERRHPAARGGREAR
jgi:hypothetical protein